MRNFVRWTVFTAATTLAWLAIGFLYLMLSRQYEALHLPTIMLAGLVTMGAVTALAAISYAAKLDEERDPESAALAARRARPRAPAIPRRQPKA